MFKYKLQKKPDVGLRLDPKQLSPSKVNLFLKNLISNEYLSSWILFSVKWKIKIQRSGLFQFTKPDNKIHEVWPLCYNLYNRPAVIEMMENIVDETGQLRCAHKKKKKTLNKTSSLPTQKLWKLKQLICHKSATSFSLRALGCKCC